MPVRICNDSADQVAAMEEILDRLQLAVFIPSCVIWGRLDSTLCFSASVSYYKFCLPFTLHPSPLLLLDGISDS